LDEGEDDTLVEEVLMLGAKEWMPLVRYLGPIEGQKKNGMGGRDIDAQLGSVQTA
jgi:hypothetical protein